MGSSTATGARDRDNDADHNDDDAGVLDYGQAASRPDWRAAVALVKRYFADAATADGAQACRLLVPLSGEMLVESDGRSPGLRGRTCPAVLSKLFELHHQTLAEKSAALRVIDVRVSGIRGLAVLEFPEIHEDRQITLRRLHGRWMVVDILDGIIE